jgi:SHS2 domain-containing protein
MPRRYEQFGTTADVGVRSFGRDLKEAFINQAAGMFSIMVDMRGVRARRSFTVEAAGVDDARLLASFLEELLFVYETEGIFLKEFRIKELKKGRLKATALGEEIDPMRHVLKTQVKAVTYHLLEVKKSRGGVMTKVVYDI